MMKDMKVKCEIYCEIYDMLCFLSRLETSETSNDQCVSELAWENGFYVGTVQLSKTVPSLAKKNESCRLA